MSCASSGGSSKKSTAAQRAVETREYDVSSRDLMQSTIGAFQDLGFTIDTLSEEFGLITASKVEKPKKEESDNDIGLLGALVAIVAIGAILSSDWDDDNDNCLCRKPKPGMILSAEKKWKINLKKSFLIGDRWKDIQSGKSAGVKTFLIDYNYDEKYIEPDFKVNDFKEINKIINDNFI